MARTSIIALIAAAAAGGCAIGPLPARMPVRPPIGLFFSRLKAPLAIGSGTFPARPKKKGEATTFFIQEPLFGTSYAWGDASVKSAARKAGIRRIDFADVEISVYIGLVGTLKVTVYGE